MERIKKLKVTLQKLPTEAEVFCRLKCTTPYPRQRGINALTHAILRWRRCPQGGGGFIEKRKHEAPPPTPASGGQMRWRMLSSAGGGARRAEVVYWKMKTRSTTPCPRQRGTNALTQLSSAGGGARRAEVVLLLYIYFLIVKQKMLLLFKCCKQFLTITLILF